MYTENVEKEYSTIGSQAPQERLPVADKGISPQIVSVPSMADIEKSLFFMKQYAERQNNPSKD
jgi:hypothetical protein